MQYIHKASFYAFSWQMHTVCATITAFKVDVRLVCMAAKGIGGNLNTRVLFDFFNYLNAAIAVETLNITARLKSLPIIASDKLTSMVIHLMNWLLQKLS